LWRSEVGSPAARRLDACKQNFKATAARRSHAAFIDYLRDDEIARDPANFLDFTQARDPVFQMLEPDVAQAGRAKIADAAVASR
jgi:hypothetical protein